MLVALASLDQLWEDRDGNFERCEAVTARAAAEGAVLVVLPEMTLTGFTMNAAAFAEPAADSRTLRRFAQLARRRRVHLAAGVILEGHARPRNTLVVWDPEGGELARYAKVHPFSHAGENAHYEGGDSLAVAQVGGLRVGLSICYDLRFPELYSALATDCDALLVIANWPAARIEHWHVLLRARAIENQCYVIGVNRVGRDGNGVEYASSSEVIDPMGRALAAAVSDGELQLFDIDPSVVEHTRSRFPIRRDRRDDLYTTLKRRGDDMLPRAEVH